MNVLVFDADDAAFEDALAIRERVFVEEQGVPMEREIDGLDDDATHFLIADDAPVATARVRDYGDGELKAERVAVLAESRGEGYGAAVMDAVEVHARETGFDAIVLDAQVPVVEFYERLNYSVESDEFMDAGIPHRQMRKEV